MATTLITKNTANKIATDLPDGILQKLNDVIGAEARRGRLDTKVTRDSLLRVTSLEVITDHHWESVKSGLTEGGFVVTENTDATELTISWS